MAADIKKIIGRIDSLIGWTYSGTESNLEDEVVAEIETTMAGLLETLYGARRKRWEDYIKGRPILCEQRLRFYRGILKTIRADIEIGLVGDLRREIEGEVFADFITLAKRSLEENKDVSAVLVCAALEDTLKRLGVANGLDVEDKEMSQVINALKGKNLLGGAQAKIITSYLTLRNKAFHAEWGKIEKPEVSSAIGFTEQFLLKHFG
jgi:hypothetical protein